jgi:UDP-N-acetylglucosamine transferase subunit ALG13
LIFVTVGTQLPFERLVQAMDAWAGNHPGEEIFMQTGETTYQSRHCAFKPYTRPDEWEDCFSRAALVVSHAGMGTILKSLDRGKPLILMPRLAALGEHRNDHQVATAARFDGFPNIHIVKDSAELLAAMDHPPIATASADPHASANLNQLIGALRGFVNERT